MGNQVLTAPGGQLYHNSYLMLNKKYYILKNLFWDIQNKSKVIQKKDYQVINVMNPIIQDIKLQHLNPDPKLKT